MKNRLVDDTGLKSAKHSWVVWNWVVRIRIGDAVLAWI